MREWIEIGGYPKAAGTTDCAISAAARELKFGA